MFAIIGIVTVVVVTTHVVNNCLVVRPLKRRIAALEAEKG